MAHDREFQRKRKDTRMPVRDSHGEDQPAARQTEQDFDLRRARDTPSSVNGKTHRQDIPVQTEFSHLSPETPASLLEQGEAYATALDGFSEHFETPDATRTAPPIQDNVRSNFRQEASRRSFVTEDVTDHDTGKYAPSSEGSAPPNGTDRSGQEHRYRTHQHGNKYQQRFQEAAQAEEQAAQKEKGMDSEPPKTSKLEFTADELPPETKDKKLTHARRKAERTAQKAEQAQNRLPARKKLRMETVSDPETGKAKKHLKFEKEVKSQKVHVKGPVPLRPVKAETGLPVLGFLPKLPEAVIGSRHLGLYTAAEVENLQQKLALLADAAEEHIDWPRLLALCEKEPPALPARAETPPARVRIAVAQDEAFCFTYAETLEAFRDAGAEVVFFSPLRDTALPENIGGLYLPGGYPELHARELSENTSLLREIKQKIESGLPTAAECGGFLYLGQSLTDAEGQSWPMVGVLPGEAKDAGRLVRFGYAELSADSDSMLFRAGESFPIHEFHHWDSTANGAALAAKKPVGGAEWRCGSVNEHFYAGFPHLYWAGTPLPQRFAAAAENYRRDHD